MKLYTKIIAIFFGVIKPILLKKYKKVFSDGSYETGFIFKTKKEGKCEIFYSSGKIKKTIYYLDGLKNGKMYQCLSPDNPGRVHTITEYRNGLKNGSFEKFSGFDTLVCKGEYFNNNKHGKWLFFEEPHVIDWLIGNESDNSKPILIKIYENGTLIN